MSYWPEAAAEPVALHGTEGVLVFVRVRVDPRLLEDLLEALAAADFPINPEIRHAHPQTIVEFPAYESQIPEIRRLVTGAGVGQGDLELANMLRAIA